MTLFNLMVCRLKIPSFPTISLKVVGRYFSIHGTLRLFFFSEDPPSLAIFNITEDTFRTSKLPVVETMDDLANFVVKLV